MAASTSMAPLTSLHEDRKNLLLSGEYSDMKIVYQGVTFNVHRSIICPSSSFFTAIFKHPCQESTTRAIQLPDDDPEPIERMISYLYTENYSEDNHISPMDIDGEPTSSQPNIGLNNTEVYLAADKFDIQPLKALAATKMVDWAKIKIQSSHFMDMARHILQLRHDPWPCHFVADYILRHVGVTFLDSDPITHLIQEHGEVGLAVLKFHGISHLFARKEAEDKHAKEKLQLQVRINRLDRKIATLNEWFTALQYENAHLRNRLTRRPERNGHRRRQGGLNALQGSLNALQGSLNALQESLNAFQER